MEIPEIQDYTQLVEVGRGGFSVVYRARQERLNRTVALKVLTATDLDDRARARFERECRAMGELSWHPHVVAVYDSGTTAEGRPWLAMEYLEAGSYGSRLRRDGPLSWGQAVAPAIQVAGALGAAHAARTLHRDLKPENLLIGPFGEAKLGDFGIAAVEGESKTATGTASFTVAHVAPEVIEGRRADVRADVYGLASTLYMLVSGRPPFHGEPGEPMAAAIMRVLHEEAPRLDGVPDDLADVVGRALAKNPDDRQQSAAALAEDLQSVQAAHGMPTTELRLMPAPAVPLVEAPPQPDPDATIARDVSASLPAPPPPPAPAPPPLPPPPLPPPPSPAAPTRRSARVPIVVGLVMLALVLAGVVAFLVTRDDGDDPPPEVTAPEVTAPDPEAQLEGLNDDEAIDLYCEQVATFEDDAAEAVDSGDVAAMQELVDETVPALVDLELEIEAQFRDDIDVDPIADSLFAACVDRAEAADLEVEAALDEG